MSANLEMGQYNRKTMDTNGQIDIEALGRKELQALAKNFGIKANQKSFVLREKLRETFSSLKEKDGEEDAGLKTASKQSGDGDIGKHEKRNFEESTPASEQSTCMAITDEGNNENDMNEKAAEIIEDNILSLEETRSLNVENRQLEDIEKAETGHAQTEIAVDGKESNSADEREDEVMMENLSALEQADDKYTAEMEVSTQEIESSGLIVSAAKNYHNEDNLIIKDGNEEKEKDHFDGQDKEISIDSVEVQSEVAIVNEKEKQQDVDQTLICKGEMVTTTHEKRKESSHKGIPTSELNSDGDGNDNGMLRRQETETSVLDGTDGVQAAGVIMSTTEYDSKDESENNVMTEMEEEEEVVYVGDVVFDANLTSNDEIDTDPFEDDKVVHSDSKNSIDDQIDPLEKVSSDINENSHVEDPKSNKLAMCSKIGKTTTTCFQPSKQGNKKSAMKRHALQIEKNKRKEDTKPRKEKANGTIDLRVKAPTVKEVPLWKLHSKDFVRKGGSKKVGSSTDIKSNERKKESGRRPFADRFNSNSDANSSTIKGNNIAKKKKIAVQMAMSKRNEEQMKIYVERQSVGRQGRAEKEKVKKYVHSVRD